MGKCICVCTRISAHTLACLARQAAQTPSAFPDGHHAGADDEPGGHVLPGPHRQRRLQDHRAPLPKQAPQHAHPAAQRRGRRVHGPGEGEEGTRATRRSRPRRQRDVWTGPCEGAAAPPYAPLSSQLQGFPGPFWALLLSAQSSWPSFGTFGVPGSVNSLYRLVLSPLMLTRGQELGTYRARAPRV